MWKILAVALTALTVGLLIGATGLVRVYSGPVYAGVVAGTPGHHCGYEWRGTPTRGLFCETNK